MKVEIKPVTGSSFEIDNVELTTTVDDLKARIFEAKGAGWEKDLQKLIVKGKIMSEGEKTLGDYGVKEGKGSFIVCMVSKKKEAPKTAAPATPAATGTSVAAPSTSMETEASTTPQPPATTTATTTTTTATSTPNVSTTPAVNLGAPARAPGSLLSGPEFEAGLNMLKEMGFPASECENALRAAYGNTDRAVEYLMSGIPAGLLGEQGTGGGGESQEQQQQQSQGQQTQQPGGLAALRRNPALLNQLKRVVQSDPSKLSDILQQISTSDPVLFQAIQNDQAGFVALMNEPIEEVSSTQATQSPGLGSGFGGGFGMGGGGGGGSGGEGGNAAQRQLVQMLQSYQQMNAQQRIQLAQALGIDPQELQATMQMMQQLPPNMLQQMLGGAGGGGGLGGGQGQGNLPPGTFVVQLTQEQAASVARLQELGFSRQACVEALLACDNNEEMAANYLFSNAGNDGGDDGGDDDDDDFGGQS